MKNNIEIVLFPPHSSHLLQPLDVGVFRPLKSAISYHLHRLMRSGVGRLQKAEWLEYFAEARKDAITTDNILAGWRGTGLFPENQHRILCQVPQTDTSPPTPRTTSTTTASIPFLVTSSPPDPMTLHNIN